jgi:hypothetical protein
MFFLQQGDSYCQILRMQTVVETAVESVPAFNAQAVSPPVATILLTWCAG